MSLASRRRALLAVQAETPWEQMAFPLSGFSVSSANTNQQLSGDSIRVYNSQNQTYRNSVANFTTSEGYEYKYECDIAAARGTGKIVCRNSSGTVVFGTGSEAVTTSAHVSVVFQHKPEIVKLALFCAWATAEIGDVTFTGLKLYRRPV